MTNGQQASPAWKRRHRRRVNLAFGAICIFVALVLIKLPKDPFHKAPHQPVITQPVTPATSLATIVTHP